MNPHWLRLKRRFLRGRAFDPPMDRLLDAALPRGADRFEAVEFVSLDMETTGLDAGVADMLSVGWVVVRNGRICLDSADMQIVRPSGEVGDSASVHGLTDTVVQAGRDWRTVLDRIVDVLCGRVLVVHHAGLDKAMLDRMCQRRYGTFLPVPVVDTLALEMRRRSRRHAVADGRSLKLQALRQAYGLPRYAAHDCLVDAIATAELLLAMVARNGGTQATRLTDIV